MDVEHNYLSCLQKKNSSLEAKLELFGQTIIAHITITTSGPFPPLEHLVWNQRES